MLFDTDVLIWAFRGSPAAQKVIDDATGRCISAVTYMELMQDAKNKLEQRYIKQFLATLDFQILPITENISHRASIYIEEYALQTGISLADALVFATAFENSLCLCSGNRKHYQAISALETVFFKADNTF